VPAATLAFLLRGGRRLPLLYAGHGLEPWVRDGESIVAEASGAIRPGTLVLCERGGWGDVLRAIAPAGGGGWFAILDAFPRRRALVPPGTILGAIVDPPRARRASAGRLWAALGLGAARFACRRVQIAPDWEGDPADSVLAKYRTQVAGYSDAAGSNLSTAHLAAIAEHAPAGGDVLVLGCGAGGEVVHLARIGYRVTGVDALPEMVRAALQVAAKEGVVARFEVADLRGLPPHGARYHVIYMTPLLYSFVAGRTTRVTLLRRLAARLHPGGCLLYSARLHRGAWSRLQTTLAAWRRRSAAWRAEPGDWYTWYLTPTGAIGYSFLKRFSGAEVIGEARAAGLVVASLPGSHFLAVSLRGD
jgi:SAM-dependent methyltransferase